MRARLKAGKEDPDRFAERFGEASLPRPKGPLIWFHAASVGESLSLLELLRVLRKTRPELTLLVTTGTRSSAELLARRLPKGVLHQFVPVDLPKAVERFLDHWRPDLALLTESEIWPRLMRAVHQRGCPLLLLNGRMSAKSARIWCRLRGSGPQIFGLFARLFVQDDTLAVRFITAGAPSGRITVTGSLKEGAIPLPDAPEERSVLAKAIGNRPVWVAASTHPGEEEILAEAHRIARQSLPDLLLILVPRHPERGPELAKMLAADGINVALRSAQEPPQTRTQIYVADTFGELGLWYRLTNIAFLGGSLTDVGGHNPFEPAALGAAILHGPNVASFTDIYQRLGAGGATQQITDAPDLARAVLDLSNPEHAARMAEAAWRISSEGSGVTDQVLAALTPWLDQANDDRASDSRASDARA